MKRPVAVLLVLVIAAVSAASITSSAPPASSATTFPVTSDSTNAASVGQIRLSNTDTIGWRNNANSGNVPVGVSTSDRLQFNSVNIPTISSTDTLTNKTMSGGTLSGSTNSAAAGVVRLANTDTVGWRNNANTSDVALGVSTSDRLQLNSVNIPTINSSDILINKTLNSGTANAAAAGFIRMANTDVIGWRNNGNSADVPLSVSTGDRLQFAAVDVPTISSTDTLTNKTLSGGTLSGTIAGTPTFSGALTCSSTVSATKFAGPAATGATLEGNVANGASAVGAVINNSAALSTTGAKIASFRNAGTEKLYIDKDGAIYTPGALYLRSLSTGGNNAVTVDAPNSVNAGTVLFSVQNGSSGLFGVYGSGKVGFLYGSSVSTPGNSNLDGYPSGFASVAAGASTLTITNSIVSANSIVHVVVQFSDATCTSVKSVIPAGGSFTLNMNANCTAATKIGFIVFN